MKIRRFKTKSEKHERRHERVRAKVSGSLEKPRLSVFKSNYHIYAQVIDDESGETLVAASDVADKVKAEKGEKIFAKVLKAEEVGKVLAKKALEKNIKKVVFDRGGYKFTGRIKAVADGARAGGLEF